MARENRPAHPLDSGSDGPLNRLLRQAEQHRRVETVILEALPGNLADCCRFGGYANGELTLLVTDSTRASQVRFQQRAIVRNLRQDERFSQVWRVRARVQPWHDPRPRTIRERPEMTSKNAELLREVAEETEDSGLSGVLRRLSSHAHDGQ
ncbi:DciA family protein [Halomonadaceae bacterium KBTZ08]